MSQRLEGGKRESKEKKMGGLTEMSRRRKRRGWKKSRREGGDGGGKWGWVGGGRNPSGGSGTETEGINCSWERLSEGFGWPVGAACASTNAHMLKQREPGQAGAGPDAAAMLMRSGGSAQTVERRAPWKHRLCSAQLSPLLGASGNSAAPPTVTRECISPVRGEARALDAAYLFFFWCGFFLALATGCLAWDRLGRRR